MNWEIGCSRLHPQKDHIALTTLSMVKMEPFFMLDHPFQEIGSEEADWPHLSERNLSNRKYHTTKERVRNIVYRVDETCAHLRASLL